MYTQLHGNPASPDCLVIKVFPHIFSAIAFTSSADLTIWTPPLNPVSLKNPSPLPPPST